MKGLFHLMLDTVDRQQILASDTVPFHMYTVVYSILYFTVFSCLFKKLCGNVIVYESTAMISENCPNQDLNCFYCRSPYCTSALLESIQLCAVRI